MSAPDIPASALAAAEEAIIRAASDFSQDGAGERSSRKLARAALEAAAPILADKIASAILRHAESPEPDLTSELDPAEDIVMGRAEWGVRYDGIERRVIPYGTSHNSEQMARMHAAAGRETVVRRTVTYGPWEEVPGA